MNKDTLISILSDTHSGGDEGRINMGEKRGADGNPLIPVVEGSTPEIAHLIFSVIRFVWLSRRLIMQAER